MSALKQFSLKTYKSRRRNCISEDRDPGEIARSELIDKKWCVRTDCFGSAWKLKTLSKYLELLRLQQEERLQQSVLGTPAHSTTGNVNIITKRIETFPSSSFKQKEIEEHLKKKMICQSRGVHFEFNCSKENGEER